MRSSSVVLGLLLAVAAPALQGQAPAQSPKSDYTNARTWLRNLLVAEERYYGDHGTYTTDLNAVGIPMPKSRAGAMQRAWWVVVVEAGGRGWWGQGWTDPDSGKGCVVFVGDPKYFGSVPATPGGTPAGSEGGRVVCDGV
jgi:hypothetical protein